jgi:hypothetical protein
MNLPFPEDGDTMLAGWAFGCLVLRFDEPRPATSTLNAAIT